MLPVLQYLGGSRSRSLKHVVMCVRFTFRLRALLGKNGHGAAGFFFFGFRGTSKLAVILMKSYSGLLTRAADGKVE